MHLSLQIATVVPAETTGGLAGWISAALALAIAAVAARAFVRLRGTTLSAPAAWAVASALILAIVEAALAFRRDWEGTLGGSIATYAAAVGTFCPLMAVLGAKRPQDRGWQWVVLSLWIVLLVPAGQALAAHSGGRWELSAPWKLMLGALVALGLLNYLPTRRGWSALLVASGQLLLLADTMHFFNKEYYGAQRSAGLGMILIAALLAIWWKTRARHETVPAIEQSTRRWLDFRDAWGAFWGLRILNRINETAELSGWPLRIQWGGFAPIEAAAPAAVDERVSAQIEQAMDSLLRRFERLDERRV